MSVHSELLARHREVMPSWLALYYDDPIELVDGKGCRVRDGEGNEYLDFFGGILTTMSGYSVPQVVEAIQRQAERMLHTSTVYLIRPMVELAERISALSGIPDAKVFFTTSGSEANDAALMFATAARGSNQVIALRNGYHGRSFGAVAVTGNRFWSASQLTPFQVAFAQPGLERGEGVVERCAQDLRSLLDTATSGQVAALIAEPVQGVGGFAMPHPGLLAAYHGICRERGIVFIADEVQTGWGRTGDHFWGHQAEGFTPDLITFAKGLGNGLTIGGVVGRPDLIDALPANSISTFGGNPLSCAGALANLDHLLANDLQANAREQGARLLAAWRELAGLPGVADVRGRGLMLAIELRDHEDVPAGTSAATIMQTARNRGLLVGRGGLTGNVLRVSPPLSLTQADAEEGAEILAASVRKVVA